MRNFVKLFITAATILASLILSAVFVSAASSGEMLAYYQGSVIVNNTWEYDSESKTLYIRSKTAGYNESGRCSYAEDGAWQDYITEIEHVVLDGDFSKCTTAAFKGHTALVDIRITDKTAQFDPSCFEGCVNLESVTIGDAEHVEGFADLTEATVIQNLAFKGTKITKASIGPVAMISGNDQFNEGTEIHARIGSAAYEYFSSKGFTVLDNSPSKVTIHLGDEELKLEFPPDTALRLVSNGNICAALYTDEACTLPYLEDTLENGTVLYGKSILTLAQITPRRSDYHGLRAIFDIDPFALSAESGYEIAEIGAIAAKQTGIRTPITIASDNVYRLTAFKDGEYTATMLSDRLEGMANSFAFTAVGFDDGESLDINRTEQNLLFRGYVILQNRESGKESIYYTEYEKQNLVTACDDALSGEQMTSEESEFLMEPMRAGAAPSRIYTKEELITVLTNVYNDPNYFIPAQHIDGGSNSLVNFLSEAYEQSGKYPALVGYDFMSMQVFNDSAKQLVADMKEYISMGGIIAFSYHMENPTGNYTSQGLCRGELGDENAWRELITEGTALNTRFNEILDIAAVPLKSFHDDGYPVIWRPMHENNGNWFWWCAIQTFEENGQTVERAVSQSAIMALWEYVYNYYTYTWGLDNLVWAYSPNVTNSNSPKDVLYCYPDEQYVDIAGIDWYTAGGYEISNSYKKIITTGKIGALTEFGPTSSLAADASKGEKQEDIFSCIDELDIIKRMTAEGLKLSYVLNWSGRWSLTKLGHMDAIMNYEYALDLDEIKNHFDEQLRFRE